MHEYSTCQLPVLPILIILIHTDLRRHIPGVPIRIGNTGGRGANAIRDVIAAVEIRNEGGNVELSVGSVQLPVVYKLTSHCVEAV